MDSNDNEKKRKRDELISDHANMAWSDWGDSLLFVGVDKQELRDCIAKWATTDADIDKFSIMKKMYTDILEPNNIKLMLDKKKKERLEKKDKELMEKLERLRKTTIGHLLKLHKENIDDQWKHLYLTQVGDASSNTSSTHEKAISKEAKFNVNDVSHHTSDIRDEVSCLLVMEQPLRGFNKAGFHSIVGRLLDDALKYVNWASKNFLVTRDRPFWLISSTQASIFSNKPDHWVVYDVAADPFLPVLSVEVQKPNSEEDFLGKPSMHGQVFDYLMAGKLQYGNSTFGILTTFTDTKVMWLPDEESDSLASMEGRMEKAKLEQTFRGYHPQPKVTSLATNETLPSRPLEGVSSAPKLKASSTSSAIEPDKETCKEIDCKIMVSIDTYKPQQLFTVLCNALIASLSVRRVAVNTIFDSNFEDLGKIPCGKVVLVLMASTKKILTSKKNKKKGSASGVTSGLAPKRNWYEWTELREEIQVQTEWEVDSNCLEFYVVQLLGVGHTSRVWRAVTKLESGQWATCVIKFWVYIYDDDGNWLDSDEIKMMSGQSANTEIKNYQAIYEDLSHLVGKRQFGGRWCVILPYFCPLTKEERKDALLEIKEVLMTNFYNEGKKISYQFKEWDQHWRHVGKRGGRLYIFDLAELDVCEDVSIEEHRLYVAEFVKSLTKRIDR